ncbi:carboxypeptidase-like regulatory domain-containing protein [Olivibacter jilunii]|uniref:carboxypeptidase-like regulatory domain-containing protein n=1 Tax=Olivibacter jilunii TaxID=985016 RepID=UPI003F143448
MQGVTIRLASNLSKTTLSDSSGNFKLTDIPLGRQRFIITAVGYEPLSLNNIIVTAGKEVDLTISLRESLMLDSLMLSTSTSKAFFPFLLCDSHFDNVIDALHTEISIDTYLSMLLIQTSAHAFILHSYFTAIDK